jgi:hypothetical protein
MDTPSGAPSVVTQKLAQLRADAAAAGNDGAQPPAVVIPGQQPPAPTPAPPAAPAAADPPTPSAAAQGEHITLSREEYNELQANAGRATTATGREQLLAMELEEAQQRLTELRASGNGTTTPPASPSAPAAPASAPTAVDVSGITFTEEENTQFGESREFIAKVARAEAARIVNELLPGITAQINEAKQAATGAVTTVQTNEARVFHGHVMSRVKDLGTLIKDKNWDAFLDSIEPFSGATFDVLLAHNVKNKNLDAVVNIYDAFRTKYIAPLPSSAGYTGAAPSASGTVEPPPPPSNEKLKISDRKKASDDYKKNRITYDQLQEVDKKFKEADKLGNVDYSA